jgi:hypothetical protein
MRALNDARLLVFAILFAATGGLGVGRAATIPVGAGDVLGLIAAITTANGNGVADVIDLAGGFYDITASDDTTADGPNGLPVITSDITINGHGATVRRTGAPAFRIVEVGSGGLLTLSAVTVSGGSSVHDPPKSPREGGRHFERGALPEAAVVTMYRRIDLR